MNVRAFNLNFQQSKPAKLWLGYLLFGLGLSALMILYLNYSASTTKLADIASALEQLSHTKPTKTQPADRLKQTVIQHQSDLQHQIHQSLTMPWPALFQALETSKPEQITLSEILPDTATTTVRIVGQAHQLADVLAYVQALKQENVLRNVSLLVHQVAKSDVKTVVNFEIEASWHQP